MDGRIFISDQDQPREYSLGKQGVELLDQYGSTSKDPKNAISFAWHARQGTWVASCPDGDKMAVNIIFSESWWTLADGDVISWRGQAYCFKSTPAPVRFQGKEVNIIPLGSTVVALGRYHAEEGEPSNKALLDPECQGISRNHASVELEEGEYYLKDWSGSGNSLLNGKTFASERLVYGDRLQIGAYSFEFTGSSLRQIFPAREGSVVALGLTVRVKHPETQALINILDHVGLGVRNGEFIGILGGSGQGKSTLLKAVCGVSQITEGSAMIGGLTQKQRELARDRSVGYVPQDEILHMELSVDEVLRYSARLRLSLPPGQLENLISQVLDQLSLTEYRFKKVRKLSGGQRRRVSIAVELLSKPKVLFLDEPGSGLDPATEADLMKLLQQLSLTGMTVICTTHVLQKAYLFNRLWWIHGGKIIFDGTAAEAREFFLKASPAQTSSLPAGSGAPAGQLYSPLEHIYSLVLDKDSGKTAADWHREFQNFHNVQRRHSTLQRLCDSMLGARESLQTDSQRPGYLTTLRQLMHRQWRILVSDQVNLLFLLVQALFIGLAVGWVAPTSALRFFLVVIAVFWLGCSNAAQQIIAELPILKREAMAGLGKHVYVHSKIIFLGFLVLTQSLLLWVMMSVSSAWFHPQAFDEKAIVDNPADVRIAGQGNNKEIEELEPSKSDSAPPKAKAQEDSGTTSVATLKKPPMPSWQVSVVLAFARVFHLQQNITDSAPGDLHDERGELLLDASGKPEKSIGLGVFNVIATCVGLRATGVILAALTGVFFGLAASVWARSGVQAVMWVPLLLIPQILLAGIVVTLPEMVSSARFVCNLIPCASAQRIMEVSETYGQMVPLMTNRSKSPVFLTGESEAVEWTKDGQNMAENYPEISPFNTSWQNQIVEAATLGQRQVEREEVAGELRMRDDVRSRDDIRPEFHRGIIFMTLHAARAGAAALLFWMILGYGMIAWGMKNRLKES